MAPQRSMGRSKPLSKQMAPAPSVPPAALPFSGDMMAFCLPSYGLWGVLKTSHAQVPRPQLRWVCRLEGGKGEDEP